MAVSTSVPHPITWSAGRSKRDGRQFWNIPSRSEPGVSHYTTSYGCTCKGFRRRGHCAHVEAVRAYEQSTAARYGMDVAEYRQWGTVYRACGATLKRTQPVDGNLCPECNQRVRLLLDGSLGNHCAAGDPSRHGLEDDDSALASEAECDAAFMAMSETKRVQREARSAATYARLFEEE